MMASGCAGNELPGWCIQDAGSGMLYKRGRLLGEGAFGRCYQLTEVASGRVYAAKVIPRAHLTAVGIRERVEREQELHGRLHHRHIVCLHGHFADHHHVYLLLEYCSRRSLANILCARGRLTEPEVRYYLLQIISGLRYLHGQGIVHRDLKLSNFLVTKKMQVKIGDLGLARQKAPLGQRWGVLCGTPSFLAPEVLDRKGHGVPSDVWALGCAMYMALTGSPPFEAAQRQELYRCIRAGRYPQPSQLSPRAQALIACLLAPEPAARPSLQDVLDHGFFTQGFTPHRLPSRACRSVPVFLGRALLCGLRRRLCQEHLEAPGSPRCHSGTPPPPHHEGAGPERCERPLGKTFISARNCLKSSH
ncbi:inactive serine/threonine-protein kinase PLK5 isoform 1-T1 [Ara ararauna]